MCVSVCAHMFVGCALMRTYTETRRNTDVYVDDVPTVTGIHFHIVCPISTTSPPPPVLSHSALSHVECSPCLCTATCIRKCAHVYMYLGVCECAGIQLTQTVRTVHRKQTHSNNSPCCNLKSLLTMREHPKTFPPPTYSHTHASSNQTPSNAPKTPPPNQPPPPSESRATFCAHTR